jgi:carbonic anhydrase
MMTLIRILTTATAAAALLCVSTLADDRDRFNYDRTVSRGDNIYDYGPEEWEDLDCRAGSNIENCLGYPDTWELARGWDIDRNTCKNCLQGESGSSSGTCSTHHQSPINLERNRGITGHRMEAECIDLHWMKYEDSTCTWQHMIDGDAFTVERHALRVTQPLLLDGSTDDKGFVRLDCLVQGIGRRWGRLDYSKGFAEWWFLSHIDFHVPSEHTQNGKHYSAEAQMYHFYEEPGRDAGTGNDNEMGTVSVFMDAHEDAEPYQELERLICQWRYKEERTRAECDLPPITTTEYPGCFPIRRDTSRLLRRAGDETTAPKKKRQFTTAQDVIFHNKRQQFAAHDNNNKTLPTFTSIQLGEENWSPPENKDWDAWILEQSQKQPTPEHRQLIDYNHLDWFGYFLMLGARTEYYFRYEGTQTIPPCYGPQTSGSRTNTNHWRVLKDPIRVHPRQIVEMQRLIASRVAESNDDSEFACKTDTAAKVTKDAVFTNRPLQEYNDRHAKTFCECKDWKSKWPDDRAWCDIPTFQERFYDRPYNYMTDGF